jgi:3-oxoacyl-[acyl-carrier-protein] synthase II
MRRVVVTGIGMVTPLGNGAQTTWTNLKNSISGIRHIQGYDVKDMPIKVAGEVPCGIGPGLFNQADYVDSKEARRMGQFIIYAIAAAEDAVRDAGIGNLSEKDKFRTGVMIGAGIGGLQEIYDASVTLHTRGWNRVSPFFVPSSLINLAGGHVSIRHGFKGPNHASVTACASGAHAIGDSMRMISSGSADIMIAGGAEACVCPIGVAGFNAMRALTDKYSDEPSRASRPYDKGRSGFVIGEGAGLLVLEDLEHALSRGARIYAEIVGYGMSGDAYHMTAPAENGNGAYRAMVNAVEMAAKRNLISEGISPELLVHTDHLLADQMSCDISSEDDLNITSSNTVLNQKIEQNENNTSMQKATTNETIEAFDSMYSKILADAMKQYVSDIGYINGHGTSTPLGDDAEVTAIKKLFVDAGLSPKDISLSSTKSATGHALGAAGGMEAGFSVMAIYESIMPPTLNLENPIDIDVNFVPKIAQKKDLKCVLSNSFGFGGTNASLIFQKYTK